MTAPVRTRPHQSAPGRTPRELGFTFPAEWNRHSGTWISWPRPEGISFPDRYDECIEDVIGVVRAIARFEPVHLNVPNANYRRIVTRHLRDRGVPLARIRFHEIRTNECWTRDHGPAFVLRQVAFSGWSVHARIAVDAPAEEVLARINPTVGVVESVDSGHCVLVTGGDSIEIIAVYIGMLGLDFSVGEPPELVASLRTLSDRYARAIDQPARAR